MVALSVPAAASQVQRGLPVELHIAEEPALSDQLADMRALYDIALEMEPDRGLLSGIRDMFTGGGEEMPRHLPVANLLEHATQIRGHLVETDGIYYPDADNEGGTLRSMGREIIIELMHGVRPSGFDVVGGEIEGMPTTVIGRVETDADEVVLRASEIRPSGLIAGTRMGRIHEMLEDWDGAVESYVNVADQGAYRQRPLAAFARTRAGMIALERLRDEGTARAAFSTAYETYGKEREAGEPGYYFTWIKVPGEGWEIESVSEAIGPLLDELNSERLAYRIVNLFVRISGGHPAWGVILMAVVVRLGIYPLTKKQIQSQRRMQAIQPQIKELQKEHATDKQKFQEEFWALCQEHDCNPLGGCLPMLVQMPILIFLYRGIRDYIVQFDGVSFLWIQNLAAPNMILLVLYTLSMIAFQKMSAQSQPAADPQQQQQQQMMVYLMPVMFFFFFQSFPAAFLLYWLGSNIIYFGEQAFLMRPDGEDAAESEEEAGAEKSSGFVASMLQKAKQMHDGGEQETAPPLSYEEKKRRQEKKGKSGKRR